MEEIDVKYLMPIKPLLWESGLGAGEGFWEGVHFKRHLKDE